MESRERRPQRARVGVESLEARAVLSTAAPAGAALIRGAHPALFQGSARGSIQIETVNPDVGHSDVLLGSGKITGIGPVLVTGRIHGTGFIAHGQLGGEITLSDARGNLTLRLDGPSAPGNSPPRSGLYHFAVEKGTGGHASDVASGTVRVALAAQTFRLDFQGRTNKL